MLVLILSVLNIQLCRFWYSNRYTVICVDFDIDSVKQSIVLVSILIVVYSQL